MHFFKDLICNHILRLMHVIGGVIDLTFSHPNKQLCIVTCDNDKIIKKGYVVTSCKLYNLINYHDALVCSLVSTTREYVVSIFHGWKTQVQIQIKIEHVHKIWKDLSSQANVSMMLVISFHSYTFILRTLMEKIIELDSHLW